MDLSTPLRRISAASAQIIGHISEEIKREAPATGVGEDAPEGPSTSELDDILDGERASIESVDRPDRSNMRFSRENHRETKQIWETNVGLPFLQTTRVSSTLFLAALPHLTALRDMMALAT